MFLLRNVVFDLIIFGILGVFDICFVVDSSTDLVTISNNFLGNQTSNTLHLLDKRDIGFEHNTDLSMFGTTNRTRNKVHRRKKLRRIKERKPRRRIDHNSHSNSTMTGRKRIISRRRKLRNHRRKQQNNGNILEITTSKGIVFSTKTQSNDTINKLIEKLNMNPEDNFDEFKNEKRPEKLLSSLEDLPAIKTLANITELLKSNHNDKYSNLSDPTLRYSNKCKRNKGGCAHICNPKGKTKCSCLKGFSLGKDQRSCHDIDECKFNNGQCETECVNLIGSYTCKCPEGLTLTDDRRSCQDVNECLLRNGHGPCQDTCENTFGSYKCSCKALRGTKLGADGHNCEDINECLTNNGGCSHTCINTLGRVFCSCPVDMELSSDWKTCQDINECQNGGICLDTPDMQSDQPSPIIACKPLFPPPRGFITCTRKAAFQSFTKKGRKRTTNSPGTICEMKCPSGYRKIGQYRLICGRTGQWEGESIGKCIVASPPLLQCPPSQRAVLPNGSKIVQVKFQSPMTDVHWNHLKSYPHWAKDLEGNLTEGQHDVTFTVRDPHTKLFSTCSFKIIVERKVL